MNEEIIVDMGRVYKAVLYNACIERHVLGPTSLAYRLQLLSEGSLVMLRGALRDHSLEVTTPRLSKVSLLVVPRSDTVQRSAIERSSSENGGIVRVVASRVRRHLKDAAALHAAALRAVASRAVASRRWP